MQPLQGEGERISLFLCGWRRFRPGRLRTKLCGSKSRAREAEVQVVLEPVGSGVVRNAWVSRLTSRVLIVRALNVVKYTLTILATWKIGFRIFL